MLYTRIKVIIEAKEVIVEEPKIPDRSIGNGFVECVESKVKEPPCPWLVARILRDPRVIRPGRYIGEGECCYCYCCVYIPSNAGGMTGPGCRIRWEEKSAVILRNHQPEQEASGVETSPSIVLFVSGLSKSPQRAYVILGYEGAKPWRRVRGRQSLPWQVGAKNPLTLCLFSVFITLAFILQLRFGYLC